MVLAQQGIVGRAEEGLSAAGGDGTGENEEEDAVGQAGEHGGHTPEQDAEGGDPLAAETVSHPSAHRDHEGVKEVEENGDQTYRGVSQVKTVPDEGQNRIEDLPVSLIQEERHP